MTAGTAPLAYDLVATQGADFSIIFSFTQAAGGLTGTTATMSVLNTSGTAAVVSSFTGSLNVTSDTTATFAASLTSTQIATLIATGTTTFKYALNSTKSALVTPWLAGQLSFLQPGVGTTTANGSFTITAGANTITGTLTVAANAASNITVADTANFWQATQLEALGAEIGHRLVEVPPHPLVDRLIPNDVGAGVKRVSSTVSWLLQRIGGELYQRWVLSQPSGLPGSFSCHQITSADICAPMLSLDDNDASVVKTGTWNSGSNSGAYGGGYFQSSTAGDVVTWTTPANTTKVGVRIVKTSNAGIVKVTIDGDATRATMLPTAQDLVDNQQVPSSALVANGGTLNPTDRCYDSYLGTGNFDVLLGLADDLDPAVHTVVLTVTAFKRAASSSNRLYISGVMYALPQTTITTSSTEMCTMATVIESNAASATEYALQITPTGGTTPTFVGCVHGYESQVSIGFVLDGTTLSQADGDLNMGSQLVVTKVTTLRHPDLAAGATTVANLTATYTLDQLGLVVSHAITWALGGTASAAYPAMFPISYEWLRGGLDTAAAITLTANDGLYKHRKRGRVIAMWQKNGYCAAAVFTPDVQTVTAGWANSGTGSTGAAFLAIEDRALTGFVNKGYVVRVSSSVSPVAYAANDVWRSTAVYRVKRLTALAETVMLSY